MKAPSGIPVHTLRSTQRPVTVRSHRYRRMGCAVGTDAPPLASHRREAGYTSPVGTLRNPRHPSEAPNR